MRRARRKSLACAPALQRIAGASSCAALLTCLLASCGYRLAQGGALPSGARSVRVAPVDNRTAQAEAGGLFAAALRDELSARGKLSPEDARVAMLEAALLTVRSVPSAFSAASAAAYRLEAELRVRLADAGGAVVYEDLQTGGEDYLAGIDVIGTEANRRAALHRLAAALAREAIDKMEIAERLR
jgi:outer membrane lipopolysaccharide assembly protein LptE/RlpB